MKILIYGDTYGRIWRKALAKEYKNMQATYTPDLTIVNIENITSGRGPVTEHAEYVENLGVDLMTLWDHSFDNMPNIWAYFEKNNGKIIRPANFYESHWNELPGKWHQIIEKHWVRILVVQLLGEVFMSHKVYNPFLKIEEILLEYKKSDYDILIVEFHRETTAELYGMAHHLSGRAALVYGTHTHVQTNDAHIFDSGTAMMTDIGMNWPFESVIWADFQSVRNRFLTGLQRWKIEQKLSGKYIINALLVEINIQTWMSETIENISFTWTLK